MFQRWSWHSKFRHPVFCIADPLTIGHDRVPLAWYQGDSQSIYLEKIVTELISSLGDRALNSETIAFGSSGGGFAALLCAQLGLVDVAIAVNPQTNLLQFSDKAAVSAFLNRRKKLGLELFDSCYSLVDVGFSKIRPKARIVYVQNISDTNHYIEHMAPYVAGIFRSTNISTFNLCCHYNDSLGHNPPGLTEISELLGPLFTKLLK